MPNNIIMQPGIYTAEQLLREDIASDPNYMEALADEGRWFGSSYQTVESAQEAMEEARGAEDEARRLRDDFELTYSPMFGHRKKVFEENYDFYESNQWTAEDRANLIADGMAPLQSNQMKRYFDSLLGEFRARESEWRARGVTPESDTKAEFMNHLLAAVAQQNNWQRKKAMVFRDSVIGGVGVASCMLDPADPLGSIRLRHERPVEFMWHLETARDGSLDGAHYVWRGYFAQRTDLEREFPLWANEIRDLEGKMYAYQWPYLDTLIRPKSRRTTGSAIGDDSMEFDPWTSRLSRQMLFKREFYRRRAVTKWRVTNGYTATHADFEVGAKDQAVAYYQALVATYRIWESQITGQPEDRVQPRIAEPRLVQAPVVDQEIWIGDRLVAVNHSDDDRIPYHFLIPEYCDGDITSYFEHGKDMQRLRNVFMTLMRKIASGFKGKDVINEYFVGQNYTPQELNELYTSEIKPLKINNPDPKAARAVFERHPPAQIGTSIQTLFQIATEDTNMLFGGLNTIGLTENAGESGRAVLARQQASAISTVSLVDEEEYFDRSVGEDVMYLAAWLDPNIKLMVTNADGNPEWRSLAEGGITWDAKRQVNSTRELRYQVEVVQVQASPTQREGEIARLRDVISQAPETAPAIVPLLLKKMDIDESDRENITQSLAAQQQFTQELQARQQQMQEFEVKQKWTLAAVDRQLKMKELELEEIKIKTPAVSLGLKGDAGPAMLSDILNSMNPALNADPLGVMMDQAIHAKFGQDKLDMQQMHRNALMTPDQKKIEALKAAGKPAPGQVPSAEATAQRENRKSAS